MGGARRRHRRDERRVSHDAGLLRPAPRRLRRQCRALERFARELHPAWIAFVGKEAYRGAFGERAELGLQKRRLADTQLFVLPSTSPANAAVPYEERLRRFRELAKISLANGS